MTDIPHFQFPFRFHGKSFVVNEQDTLDDIVACVNAILRYEPGVREMLPEFGIDNPAFDQQPINMAHIIASVERWEPRAHILTSQAADEYEPKVVHGKVQVESREA